MMIIDPVSLGDVASTRPSPKNVYDKAGTMVTVPANQVAVTYDPTDLSAAPYVVAEGAMTNLALSSSRFNDPAWSVEISGTGSRPVITPNAGVAPNGTNTAQRVQFNRGAGTGIGDYSLLFQSHGTTAGTKYTDSIYVKSYTGAPQSFLYFNNQTGAPVVVTVADKWQRLPSTFVAGSTSAYLEFGTRGVWGGDPSLDVLVWGAQYEIGDKPSSHWPTDPTFVSRPSTATYYDAAGTLQTAAANVARMTYNPSNLSLPPYLMVEATATNLLPYSDDLFTPNVTKGPNITYVGTVADGPLGVTGHKYRSVTNSNSYITQAVALVGNTTYTFRYWLRLISGVKQGSFYVRDDANGPVVYDFSSKVANVTGWQEVLFTFKTGANSGTATFHFGAIDSPAGYEFDIALAMAEVGSSKSSHIRTTGAPTTRAADIVSYSQTRAADVIGTGAGLVYSNVAITETTYSAAATYAQNDKVSDPTTYAMYQSLINANTGKALTDTTAWTPLNKPANRWQMFDSYNSTQTTNPEEIIVVVSPQAISQGVYLGNVDASEVRISVVDLVDGLVHSETQSLVVPNSGSSFYNWCFKRIRRKSYAVSVALPPYANALVTIAIRKPGGTAKCGVCVVGPLIDVGLSKYGLSREIRDFSTINFNFDGTSNQVIRNFAKRMDVDVSIRNDQIDSVIENLEGYRQKPVAWIGAQEFGSACVFGRYSSFKNVIQNNPLSDMNLQIEGTV
jgi:hypothetical protein